MTKPKLPEKVPRGESNDYQGIDVDINNLFDKFILPIDNIRSHAAVSMTDRPVIRDENGSDISVANDAANSADIDPDEPQESRAHAFYRMIGFPIINEDGEFYSAGLDSTALSDLKAKNYEISSKISNSVKSLQILREEYSRKALAIFRQQGVDSSIFALALASPGGLKPFLQMDKKEGFDFINETDKQKFTSKSREDFIKNYTRTDGTAITNSFVGNFHILRPFTVDPNIQDVITGYQNDVRIVAAPFLPLRKDVGLEGAKKMKRSGLELILRLRLKQQNFRPALEEAAFELDQTEVSGLTTADVRTILSAILDKQKISDSDVVDALGESRTLELMNISKLVKTINGVLGVLKESVEELTDVSKNIKWLPLPNKGGPERGSEITNLIETDQRRLNRRITILEYRADQAKSIGSISDSDQFSKDDFHMNQYESTEKSFNEELSNAKSEYDNFQEAGSDALKFIDIILGEASGIGLVDILAIYTALWAIDIEVLISMLDEAAFDRLYKFNKDLRSFDVELRRNSGPQLGAVAAVQKFERQVISILSYCERAFEIKKGSPLNEEPGDLA